MKELKQVTKVAVLGANTYMFWKSAQEFRRELKKEHRSAAQIALKGVEVVMHAKGMKSSIKDLRSSAKISDLPETKHTSMKH